MSCVLKVNNIDWSRVEVADPFDGIFVLSFTVINARFLRGGADYVSQEAQYINIKNILRVNGDDL